MDYTRFARLERELERDDRKSVSAGMGGPMGMMGGMGMPGMGMPGMGMPGMGMPGMGMGGMPGMGKPAPEPMFEISGAELATMEVVTQKGEGGFTRTIRKRREEREERTLVMVKQDGVQRGLIGAIVSRFEAKGLQLVALRQLCPSRAQLEEHYLDLSSRPFFKAMINRLLESPTPVVNMVWQGDDVIAQACKLVGSADPTDALPGSIRGDHCLQKARNACHASADERAARLEIALWFPNLEPGTAPPGYADRGLALYEHHSSAWISERTAQDGPRRFPRNGDYIACHCTTRLMDGAKLDSSRDKQDPNKKDAEGNLLPALPTTFRLGGMQTKLVGSRPPPWSEALYSMAVGEKATLCPVLEAVASQGSTKAVQYEVELLDATEYEAVEGTGGHVRRKLLADNPPGGKSRWKKPRDVDICMLRMTISLCDGTVLRTVGSDAPRTGDDTAYAQGYPPDDATGAAGECLVSSIEPRGIREAVKNLLEGQSYEAVVETGSEWGCLDAYDCQDGAAQGGIVCRVELVRIVEVFDAKQDKGVLVRRLREGDGYELPSIHDLVTLRYELRLEDGTVVRPRSAKPETHAMGGGTLLSGVDWAARFTKKGGLSSATLISAYAFSEEGRAARKACDGTLLPAIAPNTALEARVEVLSWETVVDCTPMGDKGVKLMAPAEKARTSDTKNTPKNVSLCALHLRVEVEVSAPPAPRCAALDDHPGHQAPTTRVVWDSQTALDAKASLQRHAFHERTALGAGKCAPSGLPGAGCWGEDGTYRDSDTLDAEATVASMSRARDDGASMRHLVDDELPLFPAVELLLRRMEAGQKGSFVVLDPKYGFGDSGNAELGIPAGATLHGEIELLAIEHARDAYDMEGDERLQMSAQRRAMGNRWFKLGDMRRATRRYCESQNYLQDHKMNEHQKEAVKAAKVLLLSNLAMVAYKTGDEKKCIKHCTEALEIDADCVKCLFRRGMLFSKRGGRGFSQDFAKAKADFVRGLKADPSNSQLRKEVALLQKRVAAHKAKERKAFGGKLLK